MRLVNTGHPYPSCILLPLIILRNLSLYNSLPKQDPLALLPSKDPREYPESKELQAQQAPPVQLETQAQLEKLDLRVPLARTAHKD